MTGRDMIIFILNHHLEDYKIFDNGSVIGFITAKEAAVKFGVGVETIIAWIGKEKIMGVQIGDQWLVSAFAEDPRIYERLYEMKSEENS